MLDSHDLGVDLEELSDEEISTLEEILQELSSEGTSLTYDQILAEDYEEVPVDIMTFMTDDEYLGQSLKNADGDLIVYPFWQEFLQDIFREGSPYQEVILSGCLSGDTQIRLSNGHDVRIEDLVNNFPGVSYEVLSYDLDHNCITTSEVTDVFDNGVKDTYLVSLSTGRTVTLTSNHEFLLTDGTWISLDSGLKEGDTIMTEDLRGVSVTSIEYLGEAQTYDIQVSRHHNYVLSSGVVVHNSIGSGKSTVAVIGVAYTLYQLLCLKDPAQYFDLVAGSKVAVGLINVSIDAAYGVGFDKLQGLLKNSPWFRQRGKILGRSSLTYYPGKDVDIVAGSLKNHFIGRDIFCVSGDTKVYTDKGLEYIDNLEGKEFRVLQYDTSTREVALSGPTTSVRTEEVNEYYEIVLEDGTELKVTGDHKFLTSEGYKSVEDLSGGDDLISTSLVGS